MTVLAKLETPARLTELPARDREAWSQRIVALFGQFSEFQQLYDPTKDDTPSDAIVEHVAWTAFPASLNRGATSQEQRWSQADSSRDEQDEYCEWGVRRNVDGKITKVTFTTELPEYFHHLAEHDPDLLLAVYRDMFGAEVEPADLVTDGQYVPRNRWNSATAAEPVHLTQENNTLFAAVALVAQATVPRERNGEPVIRKQELAHCAGLGNPFRNSDPQIAAAINSAARSGDEVTLLDPIGLYIHGLDTTGITTPDGADPVTFWNVERGDAEHALRASFEVPTEHNYVVGDVELEGRRIEFGAQLADRVSVRITAVAKPENHDVAPQPCDD